MGSETYRSELVRLQKEEAGFRKDLARHEGDAAKARAAANAKRKAAAGSRSTSTISTNLRAAESEDKKAVEAAKKSAAAQDRLAANASRQRDKQRSLDNALKSEQSSKDRADNARRQKEKDHAREISRLSATTVHHVYVKPPEPEKLRVLYLTASPTEDGVGALRVDVEVNNVLRAVRASRHRDLIDIQHRPAAAPQDLIDGINDLRPHVIHFSGHAGAPGLLFDNADVVAPGEQTVGYRHLARLLRATDQPPTCVVLNACDTAEGALELLDAVPVVIAMNAPVGDASAAVFATRFYAAVGSAQPIGKAVEQAVVATEIALSTDMDLVTLCARPEVDASVLKLIASVD
ncbi:CHAT domain-containing protein [Sphingomonas paucimobilis]|uniref:CHAT domain-containing protein n=1 Tax=Sphingomonas paucimobilis TaxID=13689 RepID=UPI0037B8723C